MGRRTLLLIASILVAAVGTTLIFMYVKSARDTTEQNLDLVPVVIAKKNISQGDSVSASVKNDAFTVATTGIPRSSVTVHNYVGNPGLTKLAERANDSAKVAIPAGSIIYDTSFGGPGAAASTDIPVEGVAVSLQLSDEDRVAALIEPGLSVAVIATGRLPDATGQPTKVKAAAYLMSGVQVIRVGSAGSNLGGDDAAGSTSGQSVDAKVVTLAVSTKQALNLKLASDSEALLSLVILGAKAQDKAKAELPIIGLSFS